MASLISTIASSSVRSPTVSFCAVPRTGAEGRDATVGSAAAATSAAVASLEPRELGAAAAAAAVAVILVCREAAAAMLLISGAYFHRGRDRRDILGAPSPWLLFLGPICIHFLVPFRLLAAAHLTCPGNCARAFLYVCVCVLTCARVQTQTSQTSPGVLTFSPLSSYL